MNIVFATSDLFSKPAMVTIKSILLSNVNAKKINIFYIENGLSEANKTLLKNMVSGTNCNIEFLQMPTFFNDIKGLLRTNPIAYTYCFLQDILPSSIDKVLLIESDTIVVDSLDELYSIDIDNFYLAATDDLQSKYCKEKLGIDKDSSYFNSGVMLLNLKKMRTDGVSKDLFELIKKGKSKFLYEVQDEMNVFYEHKVKIIPPRFNATTTFFLFDYDDMIKYRWPTTVCSRAEYYEAYSHPTVVHFTKNQIIQPRPWIENCSHPYARFYEEVKNQTPAKDCQLWISKRSVISNIVFFIYSKISHSLVARTLGVVHAYLYPKFLYKYILR